MNSLKSISLMLVFMLLGASIIFADDWNISPIATGGKNKSSLQPQIAMESTGELHIVFTGQQSKKSSGYDLFYSNNGLGTFSQPEQITFVSGSGVDPLNVSIAIGSSGVLHILFVNDDTGLYHMTRSATGTFSTPQLIRNGATGPYYIGGPDLVIDNGGIAHAVWHEYRAQGENDANIAYANSGDGFASVSDLSGHEILSNEVLPTIDVDSFGKLHVAYQASPCPTLDCSSPDLREVYYINNTNGWSGPPTQLTFTPAIHDRGVELVIDGDDTIHLIFRTSSNGGSEITYMENSAGPFSTSVAVNDTYDHNLAVNTDGDVFIAYRDPSNMDLYISTNRTGSFVPDLVSAKDGPWEVEPDLAVDGQDIHITWQRRDGNSHGVFYANNATTGPPPSGEIHVESITMSVSYKGNGKPSRRGWTATASVLVHDDQNDPVEDATVLGQWSGLTSGSANGVTDANGLASLNSKRINATGTFVFTIDNVTHPNYTFDPSGVSTNSISNLNKLAAGSSVAAVENISEYHLSQNYPNPFNPETSIQFSLPAATHVKLQIYDMHGRLVRILVDNSLPMGAHDVTWDGRNALGDAVSSGLFIYELTSSAFTERKMMMLIR